MLGTIVNTVAVIFGTCIGFFIAKGISEKMKVTLMQGLGLATIIIGAKMAVTAENDLVVIVSLVIGSVIGEICQLDDRLNHLGDWLKKKFHISDGNFINGFVSASLIFCVGAMAIVGAIEAGLTGNNDILFLKSTLDFISSIVLTSSFGIGVGFASIVVFVFQGSITLLAGVMQNILVSSVVSYMTAVGGILIIGVGFNVAEIKEINVVNLLPGIFIAGIIGWVMNII